MKKKILIIPLLLVSLLSSCSLQLRLRKSEDNISYTLVDYKYGPANKKRNLLDVVFPKNNQKNGLILYVHGGGWTTGDKTTDLEDAKNRYVSKGYTFAAMNYRYAKCDDKKPVTCYDILDDIDLAMSTIKKLGKERGIELNKSFLYGASAGGHLSLQYSYTRREASAIPPSACCSWSGPTDLLDEFYYTSEITGLMEQFIGRLINQQLNISNVNKYEKELKDISPLYKVNTKDDAVPTILAHGEQDVIVPFSNAVNLDTKLTELDVIHEFIRFPHSGHGLDAPEDANQFTHLLDSMMNYIQLYL